MSQRPTLKLKLGGQTPIVPPVTTPSSSSGTPKITLKFGSSTPRTAEAPSLPSHTDTIERKGASKRPRKKPPIRLSTGSKKRGYDAAINDDEAEDALQNPPVTSSSGIKKLKLTTSRKTPTTPFIRLKPRGKPPNRPLGVGYDSEASDREIDPAIEEEFILRMQPGDDCDYVRKAVQEKRWGPKREGGADIRLKFLRTDGRRAAFIIRQKIYAAILVDLPCVIEGMKSWDRKGWWKTADICQMIIVLGLVSNENEALEYPLPGKELDKVTWQYAHGLTPPMRWVRKRRFRKGVNKSTIEAVEEEVERLIRLDNESTSESRWELIEFDQINKEQGVGTENDAIGESEYGDQDADADADGDGDHVGSYFDDAEVEDDGLEADLELAMMQDDTEDVPLASTPIVNPITAVEAQQQTDSEAETPAAATPSKEDSGDDESDEDADGEEEVDEDVLEQQADLKRQLEEIEDLRAAIKSQKEELARVQNTILRKKVVQKIQSLQGDLQLKKAAIGEEGDD